MVSLHAMTKEEEFQGRNDISDNKIANDVESLMREVDDLKKVKGDYEPAVRFDDRVQTQNIGDWESLQGVNLT